MRFIKKNPALAAGIGLPLLLILIFSLASIIPQWLVAPPQYDVVFSVQEYGSCGKDNAEVNFTTIQGKIKAEYKYQKNNYCYNRKLYIFDAKTLVSNEIAFAIPQREGEEEQWKELDIPEIKSLELNISPVSLDGYKFADNYNHYYGGGFFPFGHGYRSDNGAAISKNGRVFRLYPFFNNNYYNSNHVSFLGWVISRGQ